MRIEKILFVACAVIASTWLFYLVDDGLGSGWPHDVVRNWEEFGVFSLHGRMVTNPGGFEVTTNPIVYAGMSPVCLYPVYFAATIFSWTGLGTLSFDTFLSLAILWAVWRLLGRNTFALAIASVTVLCPGFIPFPRYLDPNTLTVLYGLPYAAVVLAILRQPRPTPALITGLSVLILAFTSLNWTTAWVFGPLVVLYWGIPDINRRLLLLFVAVTAISVALFVAVSFTLKFHGSNGATPTNPVQVLAGYTWGGNGYGAGLTTGKAFLRLAFYNGVTLLPLWLVLAWSVATRIRRGAPFNWLMFAPLALTVADVAFMRNYFGHHPLMAGPVLLVGIIFSLVLLRVPTPEPVAGEVSFKFMTSASFLCFIYSLAVLTFLRMNEAGELSLIRLVHDHTARSVTVAIVKNRDPDTARLAARFEELLDRHVIIVDDLKDLAAGKSRSVILSSVKLDDSLTLVAQSPVRSRSALDSIIAWFNRYISRRKSGERIELSDTYFLYEPNP